MLIITTDTRAYYHYYAINESNKHIYNAINDNTPEKINDNTKK